jgi:para-aminobenzoate synthetase component I
MRKKMTSDTRPPGKRSFVSFPITDFHLIKRQMLTWASRVDICCFLDNHGYEHQIPGQNAAIPGHRETASPGFECLLAVGAIDTLQTSAGTSFAQLKRWAAAKQDWIFGHLAYDLAKETEPPQAVNPGPAQSASAPPIKNPIGFPDLFFFIPELVIELRSDSIRIGSCQKDQETIWRHIQDTPIPAARIAQTPAAAPQTPAIGPQTPAAAPQTPPMGSIPPFTPRFTRAEYLAAVAALQQHILRGDCYEINFCQEFFSQPAHPDPLSTWWSLSQASPNPFSAFYRLQERYLFCASPERYLKKTGNTLFSQPIKGTLPRHPEDPASDQTGSSALFHSQKDRSENVMVVDLVRNDLSRICLAGTVQVRELYGIYPFPQVFQMISTITGELNPGLDWIDAIQATFPMGSMTGAPKNRVVQLIGQYERSNRGIFSGAVGYVTPDGDFDFNVVIRSLLYNRENRYLSYQVGSGITFYSDPEAEYEECLLKAEGIRKALSLHSSI